MKKTLYIIGIALTTIAGCTKSEITENTPASGEISFSAGVTTRVGSGDDDCTWASDGTDQIGIYTDQTSDTQNLKFSVASNGAMTNESTTTLMPLDDGDRTYYAYHPYMNHVNGTLTDNNNAGFFISDPNDPLKITVDRVTTNSTYYSVPLLYATETTNATNVELTFNHVLAKVSFNLTAGGVDATTLDGAEAWITGANTSGVFDLTTGEFTSTTNSDSETLNLTINNEDDAYTIGPLYLIPSTTAAKLWIKANGNTFVKSLDEWISGKEYEYDITVGEVLPTQVDYSSIATVNELLGRSDTELRLSNCYMVDPTEESTYIIPVGSRVNTYWGDSDYGSDSDLLIGTDWTTNSDYTIEPLWNDFELADYTDQITFSKVAGTDDDYAMQIKFAADFSSEGNMVVAVKKGETIVWSWHIWITDYNPYTKTNGTTYAISGYGMWMDRNIGALSTAYSTSNNLYYQWGRKDPITSTATATDAVSAIADAVKAPEYFYKGTSSDYDWCGGSTDWDQCRDHHWRDAKLPSTQAASGDKYGSTKSIYDPSPLGFMVPGSLSTTEWSSPFAFIGDSSYNDGYSFSNSSVVGTNGITLPASGFRMYNTGSLTSVGYEGDCWSASSNSATLSYFLYFYNSSVAAGNSYRATGYPIRPIQEYIND